MFLKEFIAELEFGAFWSLSLRERPGLEEIYFCSLQQLGSNNVSPATRETVISLPFGRKPKHPGDVTSRAGKLQSSNLNGKFLLVLVFM